MAKRRRKKRSRTREMTCEEALARLMTVGQPGPRRGDRLCVLCWESALAGSAVLGGEILHSAEWNELAVAVGDYLELTTSPSPSGRAPGLDQNCHGNWSLSTTSLGGCLSCCSWLEVE